MFLVALLGFGIAVSTAPETNAGEGHPNSIHNQAFKLIFPLAGVSGYPTDQMVANCGGTFEDAQARLWTVQRNAMTHVIIGVKHAAPDTLYTVWLRVRNALTGKSVTALSNPSHVEELSAVTPEESLTQKAKDLGLVGDNGKGSEDVVNGFRTDRRGRGWYYIKLDYPLVRGAFRFQEYDELLSPAPIDSAPFTLKIASHCTDEMTHGLVPDIHEMWFDWLW